MQQWDDAAAASDDDDDDEGGWYDLDAEDDLDTAAAGAGGEDDADDDFPDLSINGDEEEDPTPALLTGGVAWGDAALRVAQAILDTTPDLQLYLFRALPAQQRLDIRLDRLDDPYGSPSLQDIEIFARQLQDGLMAELGEEVAGNISLEVSTPGAERRLHNLPEDLLRFQELPMRVDYSKEAGAESNGILQLVEVQGSSSGRAEEPQSAAVAAAAAAASRSSAKEVLSVWRLADVRVNAPQKGRGLSRRQREQRISIPLSALRRVRVYVEL